MPQAHRIIFYCCQTNLFTLVQYYTCACIWKYTMTKKKWETEHIPKHQTQTHQHMWMFKCIYYCNGFMFVRTLWPESTTLICWTEWILFILVAFSVCICPQSNNETTEQILLLSIQNKWGFQIESSQIVHFQSLTCFITTKIQKKTVFSLHLVSISCIAFTANTRRKIFPWTFLQKRQLIRLKAEQHYVY